MSAVSAYDRAVTLAAAGQPEQAIYWLRQALRTNPAYPQAYANLAALLRRSGRPAAAARACERGLQLGPPGPVAAVLHFNGANALRDQAGGDRRALLCALPHYDRAVALAPQQLGFQLNRALALLLAGDEARGWPAYECRLQVEPSLVPSLPAGLPRWQGQPLASGRLLVVAEQGIGDLVQFMRYGPLLRRWAPDGVDLLVPPVLQPLPRAAVVPLFHALVEEPLAVHGAWVPLLSVPGVLGVRFSRGEVLSQPPYLRADPVLVQHWRQRLWAGGSASSPLLALTWQGNPAHEQQESVGRSLPLAVLAPLAGLAQRRGWRLLALQKGPGSEQLAGCGFAQLFVDRQAEVSASLCFADTLALLQLCDRVVTSDTALVHMAGALGRPTELLLKHLPEWRWGLGSGATPWYPSVRLWRQQRPGDWVGVVERMVGALEFESLHGCCHVS